MLLPSCSVSHYRPSTMDYGQRRTNYFHTTKAQENNIELLTTDY